MSVVTNVLVHGNIPDREADLRMREEMHLTSLTPVPADGYEVEWGGDKMPEVDIWAGAFNYLDAGTFLSRLARHPWLLGRCEAFMLTEGEDEFRVYRLQAGRFEEEDSTPVRVIDHVELVHVSMDRDGRPGLGMREPG